MRRIVLYVLVAGGLATALTACGAGPTDPGADLSISLGSATVTVAPGASGTVEVTIADAGPSGDVELTVDGLPSDVTATFDPPTLSGGATTSTLTLDVGAGAGEGTHDLTITATQGGDTATAELTLTVTSTAPELDVTLAPDAVEVDVGSQGTVDVTVTGGSGADVDLTASGLPSDVTATFDPPTLSGGATTSTLTLDVGAGASEGTHDLTITATQGGDTATAGLTLTVTTFTVTGRVVTLFDQPFPAVSVAIGDQTATTDLNGEFSISGVSVPYDLVAYRTDGNASAHVFVGMTDATPHVLPYAVLLGDSLGLPSGDVQGTLPNVPLVDHDAIVCLEGTTGTVFGCRTVTDPDDAYDFSATWPAGVATQARVHALEAERDADGFAVAYTGYGTSADFTLTNGGTVTDADVPAYGGPPGTTTLTGSVATPPGFDLVSLVASSGVSPTFMMPTLSASGTLATDFSIDLPELGEDAYTIATSASPGDGNQSIGWTGSLAGGTSGIVMHLPSPPTLTTPGDGAIGVDTTTEFVISGAAGAVKTFLFLPDDPSAGPAIVVTTLDEVTSIPDVSDVDAALALPSAEPYTWNVIESSTVDSVDDGGGVRWIHDYYDALLSAQLGGPPVTAGGTITTTSSRAFTSD